MNDHTPTRYVIAGFGKFGKIALERLIRSFPDSHFTVVDPNAVPLPDRETVRWIHEDAVAFLRTSHDLKPDDIIIPMVPFHLAAAWILAGSEDVVRSALPENLPSLLPHPLVLDSYNLCASESDFLCPDDCPEGERCTVTGELRYPLFSSISEVDLPDVTILVLRSSQILPGVGGYAFGDLTALEQNIKQGRYVLATSCRCHSILSGLEKIRYSEMH